MLQGQLSITAPELYNNMNRIRTLYHFFYNERLKGVTYLNGYEVNHIITELYEVTVQGLFLKEKHVFITCNKQIKTDQKKQQNCLSVQT